MDIKKRCSECEEMQVTKGVWTCKECFNQKCAEIDDCPLGITIDEVETSQDVKAPKHYEQEKKERKKSTKERKVDNEKLAILTEVNKVLESLGYTTEIENEHSIHFEDGKYTLKLIRHTKKK
jgi:hypothetical protein